MLDVADPPDVSAPVVISVFGDESSDELHERVFSVSGLIGTDAEWAEADELWRAATKGEEFHAAEWEHAERFDDYKAVTQALIRKALRIAEEERDILKKATAFFAKQSR